MFERDLRLPEESRDAFKEPIGREMYDGELDFYVVETSLVTVGDVVSLTFRKHGFMPSLSVYDGRTERREMTEFAKLVQDEEKIEVVNPAGMITAAMSDAIRASIGGTGGLLLVDGEEDLALLPCILMSPDGADVVYGWPGKCMMLVKVDAAIKEKAMGLMALLEEIE